MERDVFFVNGRQVARLTRHDGRQLTPAEDKAEQARVTKIVEAAMEGPAKARPRAGNLGLVSDILAVARISNARRVVLKGRDTWAFDFIGDPKIRLRDVQDTMQNAAKKMSGTLWFDAADRQLARMEVTFYDTFRVGGGLVGSIHKGSSLTMEQSPVGEGLWMQASNEQYVDARIVMKGMRERVRVENSDFRRFDVETVQKIGDPKKD